LAILYCKKRIQGVKAHNQTTQLRHLAQISSTWIIINDNKEFILKEKTCAPPFRGAGHGVLLSRSNLVKL